MNDQEISAPVEIELEDRTLFDELAGLVPALALGFVLGTWFANARQAPCETTNAVQSQQTPMVVAPSEHRSTKCSIE